MTNLPANLPSISRAKLPVAYEQAKAQLAECAKVDECWGWADKAAALASYAKQSEDETLEKLAVKIRARAIRRCGQLLKDIDSGKPGPKKIGTTTGTQSRKQAAHDAGMSKRQKDTALRVANVPAEEFEEAIEADKPARIPALAKKGTKSKPKPLIDLGGRDPEDFKAATHAQGTIRDFAQLADNVNPSAIVRGSLDNELATLLKTALKSERWLLRLIEQLERKMGK